MNQGLRILIVDDEPNVRRTLAIGLEAEEHEVTAVGNAQDAASQVERFAFDLIFLDLRLGTASGLNLIPQLLAAAPRTQVVIISAYGTVDAAVEAMRRGASDFLTKPFTPAQIRLAVERVTRLRDAERQAAGLRQTMSEAEPPALLDSDSPSMRRAVDLARQVADSEAIVLLRGESGTGKGVFAREIHGQSRRREKALVSVSSPSLSPHLLESELFGHIRGAFTGAVRDNPGRIALADGGTLFLDEIGDLPAEVQPKLLRFLQERKYERVGDPRSRSADVRLVCATNVDLEGAVREKRFREDLYYRLNVIQIEVPPLRERREDIPRLAEQMLQFHRGGRRITGFTPEALQALREHHWPGNVRELKNVVERAVILCRGEAIGLELLPAQLGAGRRSGAVQLGDPIPFEKVEEEHIRRLLAHSRSLEEAAEALGVDAATLWRKRRKYGI